MKNIKAKFDKKCFCKFFNHLNLFKLIKTLVLTIYLPGFCSGLRLATDNEIMPGTGPSSCMAFLRVSMAAGLALPSRDIPLMLTNWSLVSSLPSREAAPPHKTLLTKMPRSMTPSVKWKTSMLLSECHSKYVSYLHDLPYPKKIWCQRRPCLRVYEI